MCIALVGGMDRTARHYETAAMKYGVDLHHFESDGPRFEQKLSGMDGIVIFTNRISHSARKRALSKGQSKGIPILMCHSCGISSLKRCLDEIMLTRNNRTMI